MPATVAAELLVTNLVGVLFWVASEELKERGSFRIPSRTLRRSYKISTDLLKF